MGFDPDLAEFLNHMFGAGPRGPGGWAEGASSGRSADAIKEFPVTLEELYSGKHVRMMIKRKVVCQTCKGYSHLHILHKTSIDSIGAVQRPGQSTKNVLPAAVQGKKSSPISSDDICEPHVPTATVPAP